jgi:ATP-dependent Clp protease protease subunit
MELDHDQRLAALAARMHEDEDDDEDDEEDRDEPGGFGPRGDALLERHLLKARVLLVSGPVSDRMMRHCTTRLLAMEAQDPKAPVTVMINSPGGSADCGFAIYDLLRFVRPTVRTVVNGLCASAGILIHLAGDKGHRFAMPHSRFMIHQPSTIGQGTASDLDITAQEVIKLRERYNQVIAQHTGQDEAKILEDARRDFWLSSPQALEYGLIDKVIEQRSDID